MKRKINKKNKSKEKIKKMCLNQLWIGLVTYSTFAGQAKLDAVVMETSQKQKLIRLKKWNGRVHKKWYCKMGNSLSRTSP